MTIKGIDVSSYQAATWSTSGLSFVFAKATEGHTVVDAKQSAHAARARAAGLTFGQYHFAWPGDVKSQAQWFVDKSVTVDGDLMAVDWETTSSGTMASNADKDALIKAIKALRPNHRVGLYTNTNSWLNVDKTGYYGDFLWIAEYGVPAGKPGIKAPWTFHQYTSTPIDTSVANFASKAALKTWATALLKPTPPAPPAPPKPPEPPVAYTVEEMAANYGTITSIPVNAGDKAEPHSGGYYLAHIHYDALVLKNMVVTLSGKLDALAAQNTALAKQVADLAALIKPPTT
jgi:hypothetical protein